MVLHNLNTRLELTERSIVPWLGHTCTHCCYCQSDREHLRDTAKSKVQAFWTLIYKTLIIELQ